MRNLFCYILHTQKRKNFQVLLKKVSVGKEYHFFFFWQEWTAKLKVSLKKGFPGGSDGKVSACSVRDPV